jgi:prepilin-type processing-associated H-X9-DG protein
VSFDPRVTPARPDLAAAHLRGRVQASRYVEGLLQEVIVGVAPVRQMPSHEAMLITEALRGERIMVYEMDEDGWAWGQLLSDDHVGWLPAAALLAPGPESTHKVKALRTPVLPGPDIKLPLVDALPLGARIAVTRIREPFAVFAGGYVALAHLAALPENEPDFVVVAERFVGVPYVWGGKTSLGVDCSGLVQVALGACGLLCPRDSDMQQATLGGAVDISEMRRGDFVFWDGHVAIAKDSKTLLHANAYHMAVAIEPAFAAIERLRTIGYDVTDVRRVAAKKPSPSP